MGQKSQYEFWLALYNNVTANHNDLWFSEFGTVMNTFREKGRVTTPRKRCGGDP